MKYSVSLPFVGFKWRWMEFTPIESLNRPDIFTGVTRALFECEGKSASGSSFEALMKQLQSDLLSDSGITVASSDTSRNLIRRQGRYWKGLDVLTQSAPDIELTAKGRALAQGDLSPFEFALGSIVSHELPNRLIDSSDQIQLWDNAKLRIKPLLLICEVLLYLHKEDSSVAYITPEELVRVVIPLSSNIASYKISDFADAILLYRSGKSVDFLTFPDCVPLSNDRRMAREHLLFLHYYSLFNLRKVQSSGNWGDAEQFSISPVGLRALTQIIRIDGEQTSLKNLKQVPVLANGRLGNVDLYAVRARRMVEILARPGQAKFRRAVLQNHGGKCVITGVEVAEVLQACHIVPVSSGGGDSVENGLCMRVDLHTLYDCGKLRISETGNVHLAPELKKDPTYASLPQKITLPSNISSEALLRRFKYGTEFAEA